MKKYIIGECTHSFTLRLLILLNSLLFFSCGKETLQGEGSGIKVIGHGGCGFKSLNNPLPHNSLESVKRSIEFYEADGFEVDIQMSADSILYLFHDLKLNTLTNFEGCIFNYTSYELEKCRYREGGQALVRLSTVFEWIKNRKHKPLIFLDMRTSVACNVDNNQHKSIMARTLVDCLSQIDFVNKVTVETSDISFSRQLKLLEPSIRLDLDIDSSLEGIDTLNHKVDGIVMMHSSASKELISKAQSKGYKITLFGMQTRKEIKEAILKSPTYLQTDNIPMTQELLDN